MDLMDRLVHKPYFHLKRGIIFILLAWLAFSILTTLSRFASASVSLATVVFFQNLICLVLILPWVFRHGMHALKTKRWGLILFRGFAGLIGFFMLFLAVKSNSLVDAMLLNNTGPIFLPFVLWIWLKVPIDHKLWPGIVGGFIGIIFILRPGTEIINPGSFFALFSGLALSLIMVSMRLLSSTERSHTVLFYYFLIASLAPLPFAVIYWTPPSPIVWAELIGIGLLFMFGQWCFLRAFHHAKPSQLGPFCYSAIIYSALIEWAIWGKVPDLWAWIGIVLICFGGIWTILFSRQPPVELEK
jgi:drug/metabolite transporter (DMT)-like permease